MGYLFEKISTHSKPYEADSLVQLYQIVQEQFPDNSYVYAVLDYAVGFGLWKKQKLILALEELGAETELPWDYLLELRVFDEEKELYLKRTDNKMTGRLRTDAIQSASVGEEDGWEAADEEQKLWGSVSRCAGGFCLLTSARGTRIQVPFECGEKEACKGGIALKVRRYFQTSEFEEGITIKDARLTGFSRWAQEEEGDGDARRKEQE